MVNMTDKTFKATPAHHAGGNAQVSRVAARGLICIFSESDTAGADARSQSANKRGRPPEFEDRKIPQHCSGGGRTFTFRL